jgi:hypothetical protein
MPRITTLVKGAVWPCSPQALPSFRARPPQRVPGFRSHRLSTASTSMAMPQTRSTRRTSATTTLGGAVLLPGWRGCEQRRLPRQPGRRTARLLQSGQLPACVRGRLRRHIHSDPLSWTVNDTTVNATANPPACTDGVTAPASDLGTTSATLNGAVTPQGEDATYGFEYGTSASLGTSTTTQDAGSGTQPQLVQAALTGLAPSTQYFFRLDTTSSTTGTTHGQIEKFTTPAPAPVASAGPASIAPARPLASREPARWRSCSPTARAWPPLRP